MKKTYLVLALFFGVLATVNAQDNPAKKTPPTVIKSKTATSSVKKNNSKRAPVAVVTKVKKQPVQNKSEQPKFTPPVIKKSEEPKFTPPVIIKDTTGSKKG